MTEPDKKLTRQQQKSLHKLFSIVSDGFNEQGQTVQRVLSQMAEISFTPVLVKELWKQFQIITLDKASTTELTRKEIDIVFEPFAKFVAKNGLAVNFPSIKELLIQNADPDQYNL